MYNLGEISRGEGNIEQAKAFHARCVDLLEELDDKKGMVNGLAILGHLEAMEDNVDGAIIHYEAALKSLKKKRTLKAQLLLDGDWQKWHEPWRMQILSPAFDSGDDRFMQLGRRPRTHQGSTERIG